MIDSAESRTASNAGMNPAICITGARTHNLKSVDVAIPRDRLVVVTGVSGSGKSSLVYDTVFAEGQRRYLDSVSSFSRSYVEQLERPDVDRVEGLPPVLSVKQRAGSSSARSTLATATEIHDFLRLIFAKAGVAHSPASGARVECQSVDQIVDAVLQYGERRKVVVLAPVIRGQKGEHRAVFERIIHDGFVRGRVDGEVIELSAPPKLSKYKSHTIEAVIDRLVVKEGVTPRLRESIELALKHGNGLCVVSREEDGTWIDRIFSERFVCPDSGKSFAPLEPRSFSFNSPYGACPDCAGLGVRGDRPGDRSHSDEGSAEVEAAEVCRSCQGERLNPFSRRVTLDGVRLPELTAMTVTDALAWCQALLAQVREAESTLDTSLEGRLALARALPDVTCRLQYLERVGLGFLTLDRPTNSLSGGEYQRARLAGCLGSGLVGVGYILDEPTIGLHPRDISRLVELLQELRDADNSVILVEHDLAVIRSADHLIELGPGAGSSGGHIVAEGTPAELAAIADSPTGTYLQKKWHAGDPRDAGAHGSHGSASSLQQPMLRGSRIRRNNLNDISVEIPLARFVAVSGVSGSGKSTLVMDVLVPAVRNALARASEALGECVVTFDESSLRRLVSVDQSPLGRTSRSTPATYTGIWDEVRKVFAKTRDARIRGFKARRFSFTSPEGRCPDCKGQGTTRLEMSFLPDVHIVCPVCDGRRFNRQTLSIRYHGKNVAEVLSMAVDDAVVHFAAVPRVRQRLEVLSQVGLGYLELGQSALTLSGGEAQRVRLAAELNLPGQIAVEPTLFVLDEPTTGLHPQDIDRLIDLLRRLVADGHTVLAIEHEPAFIAAADWVIDMGPEGGAAGGQIVAAGTPADIMQSPHSYTGQALRNHFQN